MEPDLIRTITICFTALVALIIFAVKGKNITFGKGSFHLSSKDEEKQFQSGNINQLLNDHVHDLDTELVDFAVSRSNYLRKTLIGKLGKNFKCVGISRALVGILRFPLYEASRQNNFKSLLKPENIKHYIDRLMKEIISEYEEFIIIQEMAFCTNNNEVHCPELPTFEALADIIKEQVISNWALPIRQKVIDICNKKISAYKRFILSFEELGDKIRIKVSEHCIEKNKNYIAALSRKPEPGKPEPGEL